MPTYLDRIFARHRETAAADDRSVADLTRQAMDCPPTRGFRNALLGSDRLAVIAEIKRRSPSKGDLNANLDPEQLAKSYQQGGASCLSVLTDHEFFGGSIADLQAARLGCTLPVLRKDFTVDARDVLDTRLMGADCVLLIAAALSPKELADLHGLATQIGLDVLVEIHAEDELVCALAASAVLVGVNQRDLVTFQVDHERACRMASVMPATVVKVAESGVRGPDDAKALRAAGYHAVLVGETLVTSANPDQAVAGLRVL